MCFVDQKTRRFFVPGGQSPPGQKTARSAPGTDGPVHGEARVGQEHAGRPCPHRGLEAVGRGRVNRRDLLEGRGDPSRDVDPRPACHCRPRIRGPSDQVSEEIWLQIAVFDSRSVGGFRLRALRGEILSHRHDRLPPSALALGGPSVPSEGEDPDHVRVRALCQAGPPEALKAAFWPVSAGR